MGALCFRRSWVGFVSYQPCIETLEQSGMHFAGNGQQALGQGIGDGGARRADADFAGSDLPASDAVVVAVVLGGSCCVANIAGGQSSILELDDAVASCPISDDHVSR